MIKANHGVHLKALVDIEDYGGVARKAGDEWQLKGPLTYVPRPEVVWERGRDCISVVEGYRDF